MMEIRSRHGYSILIVMILISSIMSGCIGDGGQDHSDMAIKHVEYLISGNFEDFYDLFDDTMREEINLMELEDLWNRLLGAYGNIEDIEDATEHNDGDYVIVDLECLFSSGTVGTIELVYDGDNRISGIWFSEGFEYALPPYSDPDSYTETGLDMVSGEYTLPGVLTMPNGEGPFPAVVLVHGSGPNDMDESIGPNKPFKDLATGLASMGVAVLRYDKRTYAYPVNMSMNIFNITLMEETVYDALAAIDVLKVQPGIEGDRIFLAGHSLGGMSAPRIASLSSDLAGIIIMAGNARPIEELVVEQYEYLSEYDGTIDDAEKAGIEGMKEIARKISELDIGDDELLIGGARAYWLDLSAYDQVQVAKGLDIPMLIIQGEVDYQVTMEDFNIWKESLEGDVTFISYAGLNHLLMFSEGPSSGAEYFSSGNVDEQVVRDIADWIRGTL